MRERVGEGFHRDAKGHRDYCCSIIAGRNKRLDFGFCHLTATDREQFGKAPQRRELRIAHRRSCADRLHDVGCCAKLGRQRGVDRQRIVSSVENDLLLNRGERRFTERLQ